MFGRNKRLVEYVLARHRDARSNNSLLVLLTWRYAGYVVPDELITLAREDHLPKVETIRRQRARIQNVEGRLRPDEESDNDV